MPPWTSGVGGVLQVPAALIGGKGGPIGRGGEWTLHPSHNHHNQRARLRLSLFAMLVVTLPLLLLHLRALPNGDGGHGSTQRRRGSSIYSNRDALGECDGSGGGGGGGGGAVVDDAALAFYGEASRVWNRLRALATPDGGQGSSGCHHHRHHHHRLRNDGAAAHLLQEQQQQQQQQKQQKQQPLRPSPPPRAYPAFPLLEAERDLHFNTLYVDRAHKFMYCYIAKNACSAWKRVFYRMYTNGSTEPDNVHGWLFNNGPSLNLFDRFETRATDILNDPQMTRAVVLRDPIARFMSAYMDKCASKVEYDADAGNCPVAWSARNSSVPLMDLVLDALESTPTAQINEHFRPQFTFCGLRFTWPLFLPVWFDDMVEGAAAVQESLKTFGDFDASVSSSSSSSNMDGASLFAEATRDLLQPRQSSTRLGSDINTSWKELTKERFERLLRIYKGDYDFFRLPIPGAAESCALGRNVENSGGSGIAMMMTTQQQQQDQAQAAMKRAEARRRMDCNLYRHLYERANG